MVDGGFKEEDWGRERRDDDVWVEGNSLGRGGGRGTNPLENSSVQQVYIQLHSASYIMLDRRRSEISSRGTFCPILQLFVI